MFEHLVYASVDFMGFFAIMNPIAGISIFLSLTEHKTEESAKKIAFHAVLTAFLIVVFFSIAGNFVLKMFDITFTAMRLTGGIIVALIGYDMLHGMDSQIESAGNKDVECENEKEENTIAYTPLGVPLLAGPGVIITAMNFSAGSGANLLITIVSFGLLCAITYYVFIFGKKIKKIVGASTLKVITKMMGLILAVIGVQMIIAGIYSAINEYNVLNYF